MPTNTPETIKIPDDIFDDEVPLDALSFTGDGSNTATMLAIMLVSAAGIAVLAAILVIGRRKSRREDADK